MDECGPPANNAVTCSKTSPYESGIKYDGETNGLTLTVQPSGTNTVTITPAILQSFPGNEAETGGVHLDGGGVLKVVLDGKVRIVNKAPRTPLSDYTVNFTGSSRTIKVIGGANANAYRSGGVYVLHDQDKEGEIGIEIGKDARIGTAEVPVGYYAVQADFKSGTGDVRVVNRGEIYGHYRGIQARNRGSGDVIVETTEGSVTSMGLRAWGNGDIMVRNDGRVVVREMPHYWKGSATGDLGTDLASRSRYNPAAILINHEAKVDGTREKPSGEVTVVSSGDLEVDPTDWEKYSHLIGPRVVDGISAYSGGKKPTRGSWVPITVHLTGGTITATRHGVRAQHGYSDTTLSRRAPFNGGDIEVTVEPGVRIGAEENPVGGEGVWSQIEYPFHVGDLRITNRGEVRAKGSGVYAWHYGKGDVVVRHEGGRIVAGDQVGELSVSGQLGAETLPGLLTTRTAGIFALHGGSEHTENADGDKDVEGGEIQVFSNADIDSKGDGIFAYAKDLGLEASRPADDPERQKFPATVVAVAVEVSGGTITAKGAGVHAEIATAYDDGTVVGQATVTVGEAATVMAEKDGAHVAGGEKRTVIIHGKVTGGGGDSAGVRMVKGGTLMIGPRAEISAESGVAVKSDGKLTITMMKDEKDRIAWIPDKFVNTADMTTFEGVSEDETVVAVSDVKTRGVYEGGMERRVTLKKTTADSLDTYQFTQESAREFREYHARARVYEALPSVLLDLNRQTSAHARLSAARDGNGGWARVWFGDGEREADRSTTEGGEKGVGLAWDFERWGAEMGFDVPTSTEGLLLGVSAHYRDGEADVEHGGRIDASGFGFGVSATYRAEEGLYVDGQVSYTHFDDIDLSSDARGRLASGLDADGYAVGLEVGRRMEMAERNVVLTPRGGLVWSSVDVDGFDDVADVPGSGRVSFGSEDSFQGRIGVLAESADGRAYASLDVEHEFSEDRDVTASGTRLDSETEATWARLGLGFRVELDETGEAVLSGQGFYALADGDNRDCGASVALRARF